LLRDNHNNKDHILTLVPVGEDGCKIEGIPDDQKVAWTSELNKFSPKQIKEDPKAVIYSIIASGESTGSKYVRRRPPTMINQTFSIK
jgi:hypothetical protein